MEYEKQYALHSRRRFLKFLGTTGISLSALQATSLGAGLLLGRQAQAQGAETRRVIFVYIPDGTPGGASQSFLPSDDLTLQRCSTPFESVKDQCIFFRDTEIVGGGGHGLTQRVLGAFAPGVKGTLDLALEGVVGATSPVASLRLGIRSRGVDPISARGYAGVTDFQDNPRSAFDRLFGGTVDTSPIGERREKKLLEINRLALQSIQSRLGQYERERLEQHQEGIAKLNADIENAANGAAPPGCLNPTFNPDGLSEVMTDDAFTEQFALQTENVVLAMSCNITRVATMQMGTHQADFSVNNIDGDYHGSIHSGNAAWYEEYRTYFSQRVSHLIQRLAETDAPEGGKLIDSTLVVQITDMGNGDAHTGTDAPYMMAGGGSAVRRGRVVTAGNHHQLLDTAAEYMGVYGVIPAYSDSPAEGILS
ncbi:DUF1552 domain-containing protein [Marinimicrobium agarilyticum]|uniref:DUF1552 domain-containing protein n=1 Tax=Marinimicrobium agarilyticum TaxID=306546 RepID=UPI00040DC239|nr:DUF1552 domain-containing protein [Marinimicrobium agarilyticum]